MNRRQFFNVSANTTHGVLNDQSFVRPTETITFYCGQTMQNLKEFQSDCMRIANTVQKEHKLPPKVPVPATTNITRDYTNHKYDSGEILTASELYVVENMDEHDDA